MLRNRSFFFVILFFVLVGLFPAYSAASDFFSEDGSCSGDDCDVYPFFEEDSVSDSVVLDHDCQDEGLGSGGVCPLPSSTTLCVASPGEDYITGLKEEVDSEEIDYEYSTDNPTYLVRLEFNGMDSPGEKNYEGYATPGEWTDYVFRDRAYEDVKVELNNQLYDKRVDLRDASRAALEAVMVAASEQESEGSTTKSDRDEELNEALSGEVIKDEYMRALEKRGIVRKLNVEWDSDIDGSLVRYFHEESPPSLSFEADGFERGYKLGVRGICSGIDKIIEKKSGEEVYVQEMDLFTVVYKKKYVPVKSTEIVPSGYMSYSTPKPKLDGWVVSSIVPSTFSTNAAVHDYELLAGKQSMAAVGLEFALYLVPFGEATSAVEEGHYGLATYAAIRDLATLGSGILLKTVGKSARLYKASRATELMADGFDVSRGVVGIVQGDENYGGDTALIVTGSIDPVITTLSSGKIKAVRGLALFRGVRKHSSASLSPSTSIKMRDFMKEKVHTFGRATKKIRMMSRKNAAIFQRQSLALRKLKKYENPFDAAAKLKGWLNARYGKGYFYNPNLVVKEGGEIVLDINEINRLSSMASSKRSIKAEDILTESEGFNLFRSYTDDSGAVLEYPGKVVVRDLDSQGSYSYRNLMEDDAFESAVQAQYLKYLKKEVSSLKARQFGLDETTFSSQHTEGFVSWIIRNNPDEPERVERVLKRINEFDIENIGDGKTLTNKLLRDLDDDGRQMYVRFIREELAPSKNFPRPNSPINGFNPISSHRVKRNDYLEENANLVYESYSTGANAHLAPYAAPTREKILRRAGNAETFELVEDGEIVASLSSFQSDLSDFFAQKMGRESGEFVEVGRLGAKEGGLSGKGRYYALTNDFLENAAADNIKDGIAMTRAGHANTHQQLYNPRFVGRVRSNSGAEDVSHIVMEELKKPINERHKAFVDLVDGEYREAVKIVEVSSDYPSGMAMVIRDEQGNIKSLTDASFTHFKDLEAMALFSRKKVENVDFSSFKTD